MTPPVGKLVLRRSKGMDDNINTDGTKFAGKDPSSPSCSKEFRGDNHTFCTRCERPFAKRYRFLMCARDVFAKSIDCGLGNAEAQENVAVQLCVGWHEAKVFGSTHLHIRNENLTCKAAVVKRSGGERAYVN